MQRWFIAVMAAAAAGALAVPAAAETCQKSGEEKGAFGVTCYYRCVTGEKALNVGAGRICPITADFDAVPRLRSAMPTGGSCQKVGERQSGMTKQCIYDCTGQRKVENLGLAELCPLTTSR